MRFLIIMPLIFLSFSSCTVLHFRSKGTIPLAVGQRAGHTVRKVIKGEKRFYLWGIVPRQHYVLVDKIVDDSGFASGANVTISEYQSFLNFVISVISLGIYIPKNYEIKLYGMRRRE